jgi:hypothetical protein
VKWARTLSVALMVLVGFGSIGFYVVAAGVVNAQPTTHPFDGWVAVLQHFDELGPEQMMLSAKVVDPGVPGGRPRVRYSIVVCGSRPFRGVLLIGGQARLDHPSVVGPSELPIREVRELRGASLAQLDAAIDLGPLQITEVNIEPLGPCVSEPGSAVLVGTVYAVEGRVRNPIQHQARFLGIDSARHSEVWPRVCGLPGIGDANRGVFDGTRELSGSWMIPQRMRCRVTSGPLRARATVDVAVPPLADTSVVDWEEAGPIAPTVRITDVDGMASGQHMLTAAGIALGIGGSLLASLLFEAFRGRQKTAVLPSTTGSAPTSAAPRPNLRSQVDASPHAEASASLSATPVQRRWVGFVVVTGVVFLVRRVWRERRRR